MNRNKYGLWPTFKRNGLGILASVLIAHGLIASPELCATANGAIEPSFPEPVMVNKAIGEPPYLAGGAKVTLLPYRDVAGMTWLDADTRSQRETKPEFAVFVTREGYVHKVHVPDLVEERQVFLRDDWSPTGVVAMSSEGLVLSASNGKGGAVLVLDGNLKFKRRIELEGRGGRVEYLAAAPASSVALATAGGAETLFVLDLARGEVAGTINAQEFAKTHKIFGCNSFPRVAVAPNGKYAYAAGGAYVHMFRIHGNDLQYAGSTPRLGSGPYEIAISADSRLVGLANGTVFNMKRAGFYSDIFRSDDLSKPLASIGGKPFSNTMAFDLAANLRYTNDNDHQLIVFTADGVRKKDYQLFPKIPNDTWQILVYPVGHQLLVRTHLNATGWVELPN